MVLVKKGNILNCDENFLIYPVNCDEGMNHKRTEKMMKVYPHIEKEYLKLLKHCRKENIEVLGKAQFVPTETWALGMVDTIKNDYIDIYDGYQYIINLFGQDRTRNDLMAIKRGLKVIKNKAEELNATIAIPYGIFSNKYTLWEDVNAIINNVFKNSDVKITIYKEK